MARSLAECLQWYKAVIYFFDIGYLRHTYTHTHTHIHTYTRTHKINCDYKYLIHLLKCKVCNKQYVGETKDAFRLRWNNYKENDRKFQTNDSCMQQHLYEHFYSEVHNEFLGNVSISLIDKTGGFKSKKSENYWMRTLKTLPPLGLNVESGVQYFIY